jgi:hypothetical protein
LDETAAAGADAGCAMDGTAASMATAAAPPRRMVFKIHSRMEIWEPS